MCADTFQGNAITENRSNEPEKETQQTNTLITPIPRFPNGGFTRTYIPKPGLPSQATTIHTENLTILPGDFMTKRTYGEAAATQSRQNASHPYVVFQIGASMVHEDGDSERLKQARESLLACVKDCSAGQAALCLRLYTFLHIHSQEKGVGDR